MQHLFSSRVQVLRLSVTATDGVPTYAWGSVGGLTSVACRLDLTFMRPGKDLPMPVEAGKKPDRIGVMFFDKSKDIRVGDRVLCVSGPIEGTFEVRGSVDVAQSMAAGHHKEAAVTEVAQDVSDMDYS